MLLDCEIFSLSSIILMLEKMNFDEVELPIYNLVEKENIIVVFKNENFSMQSQRILLF